MEWNSFITRHYKSNVKHEHFVCILIFTNFPIILSILRQVSKERTWNVANMHFHKELNFTRNLKEIKVQLHQFMQRLFKMQHYQSTDQNAALSVHRSKYSIISPKTIMQLHQSKDQNATLSVHRSKYSIISPKIKMQHYQLLNTSMQQYPSKDLR